MFLKGHRLSFFLYWTLGVILFLYFNFYLLIIVQSTDLQWKNVAFLFLMRAPLSPKLSLSRGTSSALTCAWSLMIAELQ